MAIVYAVINGYLDSIEVKQVKAFEKSLFDLLERKYLNLLERLESGFYEPEDVAEMKKALDEAKE